MRKRIGQLLNDAKKKREEINLQPPPNLQKQIKVREKRLRNQLKLENDKRANDLIKQLDEKKRDLDTLQGTVVEKEEDNRNLRRQVEETNDLRRQLEENRRDLNNLQGAMVKKEEENRNLRRRVEEAQHQLTSLQGQLNEQQTEKRNLQEQLGIEQQRFTELETQLISREQQVVEKTEQLTNLEEQLQTLVAERETIQEQLQLTQEQVTDLQGQLSRKDTDNAALREQLSAEQQSNTELQRFLQREQEMPSTDERVMGEQRLNENHPDWIIQRNEIQMTDTELGRGAYGRVVLGKFRRCDVAVKALHEIILSPYNRRLFEREVGIASRCRHPCMLQFIGATNDEGCPLIVTELMEKSLQKLLEERHLSGIEVFTISLDVARALNYLHQNRSSPIIHRDISSANVLLWQHGDQWRGKVSDYGTANFMQHQMTNGPGNAFYSAPEAASPNQSRKVSYDLL